MGKSFLLNILIIIKALAVGLWFYGSGKLFAKLLPDKGWNTILIAMAISICVLCVDDGSLSELHKLKPNTVASAMSLVGLDDRSGDGNVKII